MWVFIGPLRGTEGSQFWISGWADGVTNPWKGTGQEKLCEYSVAYGSIYIYIYIYIYCVCVRGPLLHIAWRVGFSFFSVSTIVFGIKLLVVHWDLLHLTFSVGPLIEKLARSVIPWYRLNIEAKMSPNIRP